MRAALVLLLGVSLARCVSSREAPCAGEDAPCSSVIVFGFLCLDGLLRDNAVDRIIMERCDPGAPKEILEPYRRGSLFFTDPLPVGQAWRVSSFTTADGAAVLVGRAAGASPLERRLDIPGLLFLGSFAVTVPGVDEEGRDIVLPGHFRARVRPSEREMLRDLRDAFRGTRWERIIESRESALEKES